MLLGWVGGNTDAPSSPANHASVHLQLLSLYMSEHARMGKGAALKYALLKDPQSETKGPEGRPPQGPFWAKGG